MIRALDGQRHAHRQTFSNGERKRSRWVDSHNDLGLCQAKRKIIKNDTVSPVLDESACLVIRFALCLGVSKRKVGSGEVVSRILPPDVSRAVATGGVRLRVNQSNGISYIKGKPGLKKGDIVRVQGGKTVCCNTFRSSTQRK